MVISESEVLSFIQLIQFAGPTSVVKSEFVAKDFAEIGNADVNTSTTANITAIILELNFFIFLSDKDKLRFIYL